MKINYSYEIVDLGEEVVAVPVGRKEERIRAVLKMNKEGREIIDLLKSETTEEEVVDTLASRYENDRDVLKNYVHKVVEVLREHDLIEE